MTNAVKEAERIVAPAVTGDLPGFAMSFTRHLRAAGRAEGTLYAYNCTLKAFGLFLASKGMPQDILKIHREHIESFISHSIQTSAPATAAARFGALRSFFTFLVDEDEVKASPMGKMKQPKVPQPITPVLSEEDLRKLLKACDGPLFEDRRDMAILRLMMDTGLRRSEVVNIKYNPTDEGESDLNLELGIIRVLGKGSKWRMVSFGAKTAKALDRYLRRRDVHPYAACGFLWIGKRGHISDDGIPEILDKRAEMAGLGHLHPHQLRHTFAHLFLSAGGSEGDLMKLCGWSSRSMVERYGSQLGTERALQAHKLYGPGDRI